MASIAILRGVDSALEDYPRPGGLARALAPTSALAGGIAILFTDPSLSSPWLLAAWVLLGAGFMLSPKAWPSWPIGAGSATSGGSAILAGPISALRGGRWPETLALALLILPFPLLAVCRGCAAILGHLAPLTLVHAGLVVYQGIAGGHRVDGYAASPNVAGSALVLGAIYYLTNGGRGQWRAVPLMLARPFTGARWAVVILALVMVGLLGARLAPLRIWGAGALGILLIAGTFWGTVGPNFLDRAGEGPAETAVLRLQPGSPSLLPQGFTEGDRKGAPEGSHNVPLRMAQESGILSAVAWVAVTAYALWRRPRLGAGWWLLAGVAGLSLMYYSTWVGPLGALWWVLVGPGRAWVTITRSARGPRPAGSTPSP